MLVSNLWERSTLADKLMAIYRQRMQIEEVFLHIKNTLFGLGFGMYQSCQGKRIEILLLTAMLASVIVMVASLHVRECGQQWCYQSNSIRHRDELSVWRLSPEWLRRHLVRCCPLALLKKRFKQALLGLESAGGEWRLVAMAWNIKRMHRLVTG
ncbi:hypothetical protein [Billgrantia endophytica]|uniref:hypothetical protein n=1 Tax=Billgrantia endophytica TaxID=2033802 RepID=UPI0013FD1267